MMMIITVADGKREARYSAWLMPSGPLFVVDLDFDHFDEDDDDDDGDNDHPDDDGDDEAGLMPSAALLIYS